MAGLRLHEKLMYTNTPRLTAGQSADSLSKKSIIAYLTRLLNTRSGSAPIDSGYGMSDMSNIAGSFAFGTTEAICAEVAIQIERYEPRLKQVRVIVNKANNEREVISLRFEVTAKLINTENPLDIETFSMTMRINSHGYIHLEASQGTGLA